MLNKVWVALIIIGIFAGVISGEAETVMNGIISSANDAVTFSIGLIGMVAFWSGIIKILEDAGVIRAAVRLFRPIVVKIFPGTRANEEAQAAIITNLTANFFGLGNGATPSGIEAVSQMQNNVKDVCKFLIINSAGLQLIPSTVIAMRAELGASNPTDILLPTWIVSVLSMAAAFILYGIFSKIHIIFIKRAKPQKINER